MVVKKPSVGTALVSTDGKIGICVVLNREDSSKNARIWYHSNALVKKYGSNWEIKALPKPIYKRAKGVADESNYESIASGDGTNTISVWDCVTLKECKETVTAGSHWTELFEAILTRPEEEKISGGKTAKTKWMEQVESIQNKLNMPSYSVSTSEFEFIKAVRSWIKLG